MYRYGFLDESQNKLDYVLALTPQDVLERRLQVRCVPAMPSWALVAGAGAAGWGGSLPPSCRCCCRGAVCSRQQRLEMQQRGCEQQAAGGLPTHSVYCCPPGTRLQTLVFKLGLAKSIHHARVLIRQRHIRVGKQIVNIPSFMVRVDSQVRAVPCGWWVVGGGGTWCRPVPPCAAAPAGCRGSRYVLQLG